MTPHEPLTTHDTLGALVRTHREAHGLTQQALARASQLSPVYISQIEKGERIPSVAACRTLATALGCPPRLLVLRAFRATAPAEIQDLLQDERRVAADDPLARELTQLCTAVHTLPQPTQRHLMQLWQGTLALVQGGGVSLPRSPTGQTRDASAEHHATTPYY